MSRAGSPSAKGQARPAEPARSLLRRAGPRCRLVQRAVGLLDQPRADRPSPVMRVRGIEPQAPAPDDVRLGVAGGGLFPNPSEVERRP